MNKVFQTYQLKKFSIILFLIFLVFSNFIYSQHTLKILDEEKVIRYPKILIQNKTTVVFPIKFFNLMVTRHFENAIERYEKKRLSVTLLHDYNQGEKRKLAYDVYIINKKDVQIGYLWGRLSPNNKEREIKGAEVFINNDTTILSIPFIKCNKYGSLNLKRGKYFLYVTYRDKGETYYSDTITLNVKISHSNLSVKTKKNRNKF